MASFIKEFGESSYRVAGILVLAGISLGVIISHSIFIDVAVTDMKREAVKAGVAYYATDINGDPVFRYIKVK